MRTSILRNSILALFAGFCAVTAASAAEYSHYIPGFMNIRDFLVPEKSGIYYAQYHFDYTSDEFRDANGDTLGSFSASASRNGSLSASREISFRGGSLRTDLNLRGTAKLAANANFGVNYELAGVMPTLMYVSDWKFLGATYSATLLVPLVYTRIDAKVDAQAVGSLNINGNLSLTGLRGNGISRDFSGNFSSSRRASAQLIGEQFNISDIFVLPVRLGWNGKHYSAALGYGFYAPSGAYTPGAIDNTGLGFWEHQIQAAAAWYPWENKGTALTLAGTYEINQQMQGVDTTAGSAFTLNWGISQYLPLKHDNSLLLELGVSGYSQWQVSNDSGSDSSKSNSKYQVHSAGGQVSLVSVPWNTAFMVHYMQEFYGENHFTGGIFAATIVKGF